MAITASTKSTTKREPIPAGNYIARCYRMIHIGTNFDPKWDKDSNRVRVTWELPTETKVFDEAKGPQPLVIDKEYTLSLHEKSNLRHDLESWRGKGFTELEAAGFDITNLLDKYCMLNIIHNTANNGNTYANIGSVAAIPKGMELPAGHNETVIFDYENNFDMEFVNNLPDFIREPIQSSTEWKDRLNELEGAEQEKHMKQILDEPGTIEEQSDGLPF